MKEKETQNFDFSEFSSNDLDKTSTFTDLVSRSERKQRELEKIEDEKRSELEKEEQKKKEKEKLDELKKVLAFDEETPKKEERKKKRKKEKKKSQPLEKEIGISLEPAIESSKEETLSRTLKLEKVEITPPYTKKEGKKSLLVFYLLALFAALGLVGYQVYQYQNLVNQIEWFILDGTILLGMILLGLVLLGNRKASKISGILLSLLILAVCGMELAIKTDYLKLPLQDTIPNFQNKNMSEVMTWASKNGISLTQQYEYSDQVGEYKIIAQSVLPNTITKKVKEMSITISNGPSYDKLVTIPNLVGYNIDDALKIIQSNYLSNVVIDYVLNNEIKKDVIISQDKKGEMRRNDLLTITVSLGTEEELVPVDMLNLKNKTLFEATLWLKRNGIQYELIYEFSNTVSRNSVISQSEQEGTKVDPKGNKITLIISKGKEIEIPNFNQMSVEEATSWIIDHKLKVSYTEKYDNEYALGAIIEANYTLGAKVEEGTVINLSISKGTLKMEAFKTIAEFRAWISNLGLSYEEEDVYNDATSGTILSTSPNAGEAINLNTPIKVTYSKGKAATIPDFYNKTQAEAKKLCTNAGLKCTYSSGYHNTVASGNIYKQSMAKNSQVPEGTQIVLYLSKGKQPSGGGNTPPPACTATGSRNLLIQPSWVTGGSANATISTLKSKFAAAYPYVTFNFVTKPGNDPAGYIHADSPITNGSTIKDCNTYTVIINE